MSSPVLTADNAVAAQAFDAAVNSILAHRADAPVHLAAALAADPALAIAHALAGFLAMLQARREAADSAAGSLSAARRAIAARGGSLREHAFVAALAAWLEDGDMIASAGLLEHHLLAEPRDAAAIKLAHGVRFMLGDAVGMRFALERALPAWDEDTPGHAFILGCHAFALEETGDRRSAERVGRLAVAREPADLWGTHAVAHVLEGEGRARDGIAWLATAEARLPEAGNFARHLFWHRALFHLHLGETDAALALYDSRVREVPTEDFRDAANAASLLWRLASQGVRVGDARWQELADFAERRIGDHSLAFADLHYVLSLAAAGRRTALAAFLSGMRGRALRDTDTQARVIATAGLAVARAVAAAIGGEHAEAADLFATVRPGLQRLGGSHAQRDVFERMDVDAAIAAGRGRAAADLLAHRATRRAPGAWEADRVGRLGLQPLLAVSAQHRAAAPRPALPAPTHWR